MRLSSELIIDLSQLNANLNILKSSVSNDMIFMVKGNAYGHGLNEITHFSSFELGVKRFGLASIGEARELRRNFPKMRSELWVFSETCLEREEAKELYLDYNIIPVIHSLRDLKIILSDTDYRFLPLVLKFDTGMHRLGIEEKDLELVISILKSSGRLSVEHVMTHFGNAYLKIKDGDRTNRQYDKFLKIVKHLRSSGININETSCANSGACEQGFALAESHIRPGLMLYGASCGLKSPTWQGKLISTFKTEVLKITEVTRGTPIGYGGHVVGKNGYIVYLPLGHADGILSSYSSKKILLLNTEAQFLGRINMDLVALFFEFLPKGLRSGSQLDLWNTDTNMVDFSDQLSTSSYQIFSAITNRVPRRYLK